MPDSSHYVFALQIEDPRRFKDIFGSAFSAIVWHDIVHSFSRLSRQILIRYSLLSDIVAPRWGRCFCSFQPKQPAIQADMEEQAEALTAAARQLVREMLQRNLGAATGSRWDFKVVVTPAREDYRDPRRINRELDSLFNALPVQAVSLLSINRDQLVEIITEKKVEIYLQPIVALPGEAVIGYEALSRGRHAGALLGADQLFAAAAHLGLTEELELVCIENALDAIKKIPEPYWLSINVGPALLKSAAFAALVFKEGLKPFWPRIVFELTEHLPLESVLELQAAVQALNDRGMCLSLDDTGCGFFDLSTVEKFRPRIVKLCITIIRRIGRSKGTYAEFSDTVSRLAEYGDCVLGEGVEEKAQVEVLKQCGVAMAQGYFFDKPLPVAEVFGDSP